MLELHVLVYAFIVFLSNYAGFIAAEYINKRIRIQLQTHINL